MVDIDVGTNLLEWGEYDEAERVLSECLDFVTSNKEATDDEILKAQSAMAALFRAQGKYKEAKQLYLEAMKVARKIESRALSNGIPPVFKELNTSTSQLSTASQAMLKYCAKVVNYGRLKICTKKFEKFSSRPNPND